MGEYWDCQNGHQNEMPLYASPGACAMAPCDGYYDGGGYSQGDDPAPAEPEHADDCEEDTAASMPPEPASYPEDDATQDCPGAHEAAPGGSQTDLEWIFDPEASTIDRLADPEAARRYRQKRWDRNDYPGNDGPNEGIAARLHRKLRELCPERRANSGPVAVVTRRQFERSAKFQRYVRDQVSNSEGLGDRINKHAAAAFVRMRDAAAADGVTLDILDGYRSPEVSQARAEENGNPNAVASFSSHNLGLAVDLRMSQDDQTYSEVSTRPFSNVIAMRQSPVHKWLFLNAARFGWYPYTNEPWHWEYNPEGFSDTFREEYS